MSIIKNQRYCISCWHAEPLSILRKTWNPNFVLKLHSFHYNLARITQKYFHNRAIKPDVHGTARHRWQENRYVRRRKELRIWKWLVVSFFPWKQAKHNELVTSCKAVWKRLFQRYAQQIYVRDTYMNMASCV